jgi:hypothetical protein
MSHAPDAPPRRKPWEEKNLFISGLLAYLIPGLGHFYQGRWFKGCVYSVCILSTYFLGLKLGEGAVVYSPPKARGNSALMLYIAQVGVGLPALPAVYQQRRAADPTNRALYELTQPLEADFTGDLLTTGPGGTVHDGVLAGRLSLKPGGDGPIPVTRGTFVGTLNGAPIELDISGGIELDRPIAAGYRRRLECSVARASDQHPQETKILRGAIPRPFQDGYCAPPDDEQIEDLNRRLGKVYDLAIACTLMAGLLNILAFWDAVDGPAYGFGDEPPPENPAEKK